MEDKDKFKFMVIDATDMLCIGGFGNKEGNIGLTKYSNEEIKGMILENNELDDTIRLVWSLLDTIRELNKENG